MMNTDLRQAQQTNGRMPAGATGGESDVTIRMLRQQLAKGNLKALPLFIKQAKTRAAAAETDQRLATMLLCAAAGAARALGEFKQAGELLQSGHAGLPAFSLDLLAKIKRLEARILLDQGNVTAARMRSDEIDSFEFVRVQGAAPMFVREEDKVSAETWALIAEIALVEGQTEEAWAALEKAAQKLTCDEQARLAALGPGGTALAAYDPEFRRLEQEATETGQYLRFLESMWRIQRGDEEGRQQLQDVRERIVEEEQPDAPMSARIVAALGEWATTDEGAQPPPGINIQEARRWHRLGTTRVEPRAEVVSPVVSDRAATTDAVDDVRALEPAPSGGAHGAEMLFSGAIMRLVDELERRAAGRNTGGADAGTAAAFPDNFSIGGSFKDFDIFSLLSGAGRARLTGYVLATWRGDALEEMIRQGHIHEAARTGRGYIFLREGLIIDATLSSPDEGTPSADARQALTALILIGIGVGSAGLAEGQGRAYPDESVAQRQPRLEVTSNDNFMLDLLNVYEEANKSDGTAVAEAEPPQVEAGAETTSEQTPATLDDTAVAALPNEGEFDELFGALEAGPQAETALSEVRVVSGEERGIAAAHFRALISAPDRQALVGALCAGLEVYSGGAAFARLLTGERTAARAQSSPWTAGERDAAAAHGEAIEIGAGLRIEVGTVGALEPALLQTLLEAAALRLRVMPRAQKVQAACLTSAAAAHVIVHSTKLRSVYDRVATLAPQDGLAGRGLAHILITGETGVGKELVARRIHELSGRASGPFKSINLAGMPKDLIRSAIFGHVRGAFSGATADQMSLFEQTEGGTLLVDEFGELDLNTQAMVLRVLEESEFNRIGESRAPRRLNSRIIFATNRKIDDETIFRPDIKFRCKVIRIPALREHPEDIRPMAIAFGETRGMRLLEAALLWCEGRAWPGNVRELRGIIEEAAESARERGDDVTLADVMEATEQYEAQMSGEAEQGKSELVRPGESMAEALNRIEREMLQAALDQAGAARGRKTRAAAIFGEKRQTFAAMLNRHGLDGASE